MRVANFTNLLGDKCHLHYLKLIGAPACGRAIASNLLAWLKQNRYPPITHPRIPDLLMLKSRSAAPLRGSQMTKATLKSNHRQMSLKPGGAQREIPLLRS